MGGMAKVAIQELELILPVSRSRSFKEGQTHEETFREESELNEHMSTQRNEHVQSFNIAQIVAGEIEMARCMYLCPAPLLFLALDDMDHLQFATRAQGSGFHVPGHGRGL